MSGTRLTRLRRRVSSNSGQVLALYSIALPAMLCVVALALDGGKLFVAKLHTQNAADAAALASAQDIGPCLQGPGGACDPTTLAAVGAQIQAHVNSYSSDNGGPSNLVQCAAAWYAENAGLRHIDPDRDPTKPTGCYTWPYVNGPNPADTHWDEVEVRIRKPTSLEFAHLVGFHNPAYPFARSVGRFNEALLVTTNPGVTTSGMIITGQPHTTITPGPTHTTTDPDTTVINTTTTTTFSGGNGGVAFIKGTDCLNAAAGTDWPGDPGGASVQWSGAPSTFSSFITNGGVSIDGANRHQFTHIFVGKHNAANCERFGSGALPLGQITGPFAPEDWPFPAPPAPPAGCLATGTGTIAAPWISSHPPGVYCFTSGPLTISANGATFDGYSFYAPSITANSNSMIMNPSLACGTRQVLFDAYAGDLNLSGNGDNLRGDMYAMNGMISLNGGGSFAGCGFMETLKLIIGGNFAGYQGTGPGEGGGTTTTTNTTTTVIPGGTHTTTDPDVTVVTTDPDIVIPGTTNGSSVVTATTSTNVGLGE